MGIPDSGFSHDALGENLGDLIEHVEHARVRKLCKPAHGSVSAAPVYGPRRCLATAAIAPHRWSCDRPLQPHTRAPASHRRHAMVPGRIEPRVGQADPKPAAA